jgi:hypothetical protein
VPCWRSPAHTGDFVTSQGSVYRFPNLDTQREKFAGTTCGLFLENKQDSPPGW